MIREKLAKEEKVSFILSTIIIILLVLCIILLIYNNYFRKTKLEQENINVSRLYSYISHQNDYRYRNYGFSYDDIKVNEELLASDIKQGNKNYMGYYLLLSNELLQSTCANTTLEHDKCGTLYYETKKGEVVEVLKKYDASTTIFTNENLRNKVLNIFGYGSYKITHTIKLSNNIKYNYDQDNNIYAYNNITKDELDDYVKDLNTKFEKAILISDRLEITESISDGENHLATLVYVFKLDDTNNYYLYSIKREK